MGPPADLSFVARIDGSTQRYVEMRPPNATNRAFDVLIALHGHGSDRWQYVRDGRGECKAARDFAAAHGMLYVSPDYRARTSWMGPAAEADMVQLIARLRRKHRIRRVFLTGGSMGGTSALIFAALHPDLVAGVSSQNGTANMMEYAGFQEAIAASYGGNKRQKADEYRRRSPERFPGKLTMPVAFAVGGRDSTVPPDCVRRLAKQLKKQRAKSVLLLDRKDGGHATTYADTMETLDFVLKAAAKGEVMTKLAIDGGKKAVRSLGPYTSKIHKEELVELLDLWQFAPGVKEKMVALVEQHAGRLKGPHLFRYYNPRPSKVDAAEKAFAKYIGVRRALAVNSCTSALIASLRALGVGMGDEVIVPAYTFFASAAVIAASNAIPVIADVDDTLTLDPKDVARRITPRTKAIIVVHMRGLPAQMDELMAIANKHRIPVIEDVAQAAGGRYKGRMLGSIGAMGCFSFDYYKVLNSGEGGFITTNDPWLHTRAQSWHDCAACWRPNRFASERREGELFCGENYRMSELQGAVALAQIRKAKMYLRGYRAAKKAIVKRLVLPKGVRMQPVSDPAGDTSICLILFLPDVDMTRRALAAMQAEGVPAGGIYDHKVKDWHIYVHWEHILQHKSVARDGLPWSGALAGKLPVYTQDMCPQSTALLSRAIMIDINWEYSAADCAAIAKGINKVLSTCRA